MPASAILQALRDEAPADHFTLDWLMRGLHKQSVRPRRAFARYIAAAPGICIAAGTPALIAAFQAIAWPYRSYFSTLDCGTRGILAPSSGVPFNAKISREDHHPRYTTAARC